MQWLHASCRLGPPKFKVSGEQDTAGQLTVSVPPGYILNIWVHYEEESVQSFKDGLCRCGWCWLGWCRQCRAGRQQRPGLGVTVTKPNQDLMLPLLPPPPPPPPPPPLDGSSRADFLVPEFWVSARKNQREKEIEFLNFDIDTLGNPLQKLQSFKDLC